MLFLPLKHTVSFCYGRFRFFGSHFAGIACYRVLALVFLWALGLVQVLRAQDLSNQLLQDISNKLESGFSVNNQNRRENIDLLHQALGYYNTSTSNNTLEDDIEDLKDALNLIKMSLGYYSTAIPSGNLSEDLNSVISSLETLKDSLTSSLTKDDVKNVFSSWFGSESDYAMTANPVFFRFLSQWYGPRGSKSYLWDLVPNPIYWSPSQGFSGAVLRNPYGNFTEYLANLALNVGAMGRVQYYFLNELYKNSVYLQHLSYLGENAGFESYMDRKFSELISSLGGGSGGSVSVDLSELVTAVQDLSSSLGWDRYETQKAFWDTIISISDIDVRQLTYKSTKTPQDITFFWTFDKQEKKPVSSLADFLTVFSANQNEGFIRLNRNIASLGDMNYWATTNIVSAINPGAYWGDPSEDLSQMETNKQFVVSVSSSGSSSTLAQSYEPVSTNDLGVIGVQISANTNKLYEVRSDEVASKYLRNPFGEASSSDSIGSVSSGGYEVLSIGGVEMDMEDAYNSFKTNFLDRVAPPLKTGFGALWVFLSVLFASIAIRKCVSGGV